jgi:multidrug efflux pump
LSEVARVVQAQENVRLAAWADLKPAIILNVQRQPGANVIQTVDAIQQRLPELTESLPASVKVTVLSDRTGTIRASIEHVTIELFVAVALVVLVILLFLRSVRATIIASLAVPISLLGTCGAMFLLGYSLNNLTLMALTIATGFVVDDAIVSQENISRYIERGETPMQAALKGAGEIGFTIISLTVSLIAVLIPLLFMSDVVGRLFREFAVTLAITIIISALVSLTLVPMMAARMLRADDEADPPALARSLQAGFDRLLKGYRQMLSWVLERQTLTLLVALGTLLLTVLLYIQIPKGLFPQQDTGRLQARVEAHEGISFGAMATLQQAVARELLQDPDVASLSSQVGVGNGNPMLHTGSMLINLRTERSGNQQQIMDRLRARASQVAGASLYVQPLQDLTIDAETGPTQYRVALEGADSATVQRWTELLVQQLANEPAVRHVGSDVGVSAASLMVSIDRDSASRLAVSAAAIDDALYNAFGQRIVSTIFTETNQFRVVLEAAPGTASSAQSLADIPIKTGSGKATTLGAIATVREQASPLQITRVGQFPATTIGFDTAPGVALEDAVRAIRKAAQEIGMPAAVTLNFLGAAGAFDAALENQLWLILAAVICVYIVLGVLYESYVHPLTILSTLPSAGVGALLALMIAGQELGVIGVIGIILLIGIVKKNAIMMIDFAIAAEREQNKSPREAIEQAALLRFRPILMTTLAALFAALPLMLGWGEGAELRHPMGLAIFGGLVLSQLLTLFTTPVIYLGFDRLGRYWFGTSTRTGTRA